MNFSCRYSGRCKNSLLVIARRSFTGQTMVFFQFFVPLKQAEKEKSEALDKYLRIGIILPSLLYGHLF